MGESRLSSVSQADSLEKIGEFWDTHDFTEFDSPDVPDVEFEVPCAVPVEVNLLTQVEEQARLRFILCLVGCAHPGQNEAAGE